MRTFSLSHCGLRESTGDTWAVLTLLQFNIRMLKGKGQCWRRFGRSVSDKDGLMCSFVDDVCSGGSCGEELWATFVPEKLWTLTHGCSTYNEDTDSLRAVCPKIILKLQQKCSFVSEAIIYWDVDTKKKRQTAPILEACQGKILLLNYCGDIFTFLVFWTYQMVIKSKKKRFT